MDRSTPTDSNPPREPSPPNHQAGSARRFDESAHPNPLGNPAESLVDEQPEAVPLPSTAKDDETESPPNAEPATLWLRHADRAFLAALLLAGFVLIAVHGWRLTRWGLQPPDIERGADWHAYRLDINSATWVEWLQLDGIGETLARRIVDDREQNGPFDSIDDLQRVKGIGPKTVAKLRPFLRIDTERPATP